MNKGRCSGSIRDDYTTDNVTDADDEILESLVKTATRTPHTQARERKRNNRHTHADRSARKYHTTHFLLHLIISLFFLSNPPVSSFIHLLVTYYSPVSFSWLFIQIKRLPVIVNASRTFVLFEFYWDSLDSWKSVRTGKWFEWNSFTNVVICFAFLGLFLAAASTWASAFLWQTYSLQC